MNNSSPSFDILLELNRLLLDNINTEYDKSTATMIIDTLSTIQCCNNANDIDFENVLLHTMLLLDLGCYSNNMRIKTLTTALKENILTNIMYRVSSIENAYVHDSIYQERYNDMFKDKRRWNRQKRSKESAPCN